MNDKTLLKIVCGVWVLLLLAMGYGSYIYSADYTASKTIDTLADVSASLTKATLVPVQDMGDTDKVGSATVEDFGEHLGAVTGTGKISTTVTTEQLKLSYDATNYLAVTVLVDGHTTFATDDPDGVEADINFTPDGNVGIKTAAPSVELDVTGAIKASGTVSGATYASDGSVTDAELKHINTLSSNAQTQITNNAALVDEDDELIAIINASPGTYIDVAAGGTGIGTITDHCVVVGSGTADVTILTIGAAKTVLKGVATSDPAFAVERAFTVLDKALANETNTAVTEAQILAAKFITNQGSSSEADLVLPALSYYVSFICIVNEAHIIEWNPPSGELFDLDGTDLDADDVIDSPVGIGAKMTFTRMKLADGSTWRWSADTIRGAWVDGAASD